MLSKPVFLVLYADDASAWYRVIIHGMTLDMAVAGYLTIIPALLLIVCSIFPHGGLRGAWRIYWVIAATIFALCLVANIALYAYWGFPLDSTPLFYFTSSPKDAVASASLWQIIGGVAAVAIVAAVISYAGWMLIAKTKAKSRHRIVETLVLLLMCGMLFLPIRGGFGVSVNNVGSVFFSDDIRLNHAAVNPLFSMLESLGHDDDFASQYRFMPEDEAAALFHEMTSKGSVQHDSILHPKRVVIVILESFSSYIMDGGEGNLHGITPTLNSISNEGLFFTRFYANSFRTDRGLVAILSGYPAQPTMSLMKYPHKTNSLYSIARSMQRSGYDTHYIYGGDANFTNMRSYLKATGFQHIVSEDDFPANQRTGKWGVNDSLLFRRAIDHFSTLSAKPSLTVIQTSSSHEPYDVPHHFHENPKLNAFHYTDEQLGHFLSTMRQQPGWDSTLMVIVPDHLGCYPDPKPDGFAPYFNHIPLFIIGGMIDTPRHIDTIGSQQDIAATLLGMMGISHDEFLFSKDLLDPSSPHFAFFTFPDAVGLVTSDNHLMYDNLSGKLIYDIGCHNPQNLRKAQAYLQSIYNNIDTLGGK